MSEPQMELEAHDHPGYAVFFIVWAVLLVLTTLLVLLTMAILRRFWEPLL